MRTIKFRGYNKKNEWLYGYYFVNRGKHYIVDDVFVNPFATPEDFEVVPDTIGQFTGLKDKDGNEIYEGDILGNHPIIKDKDVVIWDDDLACFIVGKIGSNQWFSLHNDSLQIVIGNIHNCPELLKGGK